MRAQKELKAFIMHLGIVVNRNYALIAKRRMQARYRRPIDRRSMTPITILVNGKPRAGHAQL